MAWMDNFSAEMNKTIVITGKGNLTGTGADGQPTYATDIEKFSGLGAFWQLSAGEIFAYDRIGNPSTHKILIDPAKITAAILPADTATINGKVYDIFPTENILDLGDVEVFTVRIRK